MTAANSQALHPGPPRGLQEPKQLAHILLLFLGKQLEAGSAAEQLGHELVLTWDARVASSNLTCYTSMAAPVHMFLSQAI